MVIGNLQHLRRMLQEAQVPKREQFCEVPPNGASLLLKLFKSSDVPDTLLDQSVQELRQLEEMANQKRLPIFASKLRTLAYELRRRPR